MNQLLWQLKRSSLFSFLILLRLLSKIGSGPQSIVGFFSNQFRGIVSVSKELSKFVLASLQWTKNLILANLKLVLLLFVIFLSWQSSIAVNSFLNSLPKINQDIINNSSVPRVISIYDQNDNLLAKVNRDYYRIPINLSQVSIPVLQNQKDVHAYSQKMADLLLTDQFGIQRSIKRNILVFKIRRMFSRDQILTAYLNTLTFPDHIIGIEAASEHFLGKNASLLSLEDYQTLIRFNLNQESPKLKFPLYQRASDPVDFVLVELKNRHPDIWNNNQEIKVFTAIDLKMQNYLQQSNLQNMSATKSTGLAIIDTKSHLLLALVGRFANSNKPEVFLSIKKVTDLKQSILAQSSWEITPSSFSIISTDNSLSDKNLLNKLTQNLPVDVLDSHLVTTKLEGR